LSSVVDAASYVFMVSMIQFWGLQDDILKNSIVCEMNSDFDNVFNGVRDTILILILIWKLILIKSVQNRSRLYKIDQSIHIAY
jgi:hypothetical protein